MPPATTSKVHKTDSRWFYSREDDPCNCGYCQPQTTSANAAAIRDPFFVKMKRPLEDTVVDPVALGLLWWGCRRRGQNREAQVALAVLFKEDGHAAVGEDGDVAVA